MKIAVPFSSSFIPSTATAIKQPKLLDQVKRCIPYKQMSNKHMDDMPVSSMDMTCEAAIENASAVHEARLWREDGWTARVIKNEDDEGWAVEMIKHGEAEPALVGPWTMGRDKKNPKPLDAPAFATLVKTASEVLRRHEQQLQAMLHKSVNVIVRSGSVNVTLDIVPDEDDPYALLTAQDDTGAQLAQIRVAPTFKLSVASASAWIEGGFRKLM